jgi:hypothetical protein
MSELVNEYIALHYAMDFSKAEEEIDEMCDRLCDMEESMTLEELQSLDGKIAKRSFHERILPLINEKQG